MIDIKAGEGLCEYIRRANGMKKEISQLSDIPKIVNSDKITITGGAEFIGKFLNALPEEYK